MRYFLCFLIWKHILIKPLALITLLYHNWSNELREMWEQVYLYLWLQQNKLFYGNPFHSYPIPCSRAKIYKLRSRNNYPSEFWFLGWMLEIWSKVDRHCNISIEGHSWIICTTIDVLESLTYTFAISVK